MIQAVHKGIEIELELHQQTHDYWKCDYTLISHPDENRAFHLGDKSFPAMDLAEDDALQDARNAIDRLP